MLNPIYKGDRPLITYHIHHLGPWSTTGKGYKYIFIVVDAFSRFVWIHPTKTTKTDEVIDKLTSQKIIFGNPKVIISDGGTAFTSKVFEKALNSTYQRSIGNSPFKILFGTNMNRAEDRNLTEIIKRELVANFIETREELHNDAKQQMKKVQNVNIQSFNKERKVARKYNIGEMGAIEKTKFETGAKLLPKFIGPYIIKSIIGIDRFAVEKLGNHIGPKTTTCSADHMKPWSTDAVPDEFETNSSWGVDMWGPEFCSYSPVRLIPCGRSTCASE